MKMDDESRNGSAHEKASHAGGAARLTDTVLLDAYLCNVSALPGRQVDMSKGRSPTAKKLRRDRQ
jgi:hypothetical protein